METLIINIPDKKSALVKQLLKELGVAINSKPISTPNKLTIKTIENAHNGIGLGAPIRDINDFVKSL